MNSTPAVAERLEAKLTAGGMLVEGRAFLLELLLKFPNRVHIIAVGGLLGRVVNSGYWGYRSCRRRSELLVHLMALLRLRYESHLRQRLQRLLLLMLSRLLMHLHCR